MIVLSDAWWFWVWQNFSMSILGFPLVVSFLLKLIAIYNPNFKGKDIADLMEHYWPTKKPVE
jgi:hypothetical protein